MKLYLKNLIQPSSIKSFLLISAGLIIAKSIVEGIWDALTKKKFFEVSYFEKGSNTLVNPPILLLQEKDVIKIFKRTRHSLGFEQSFQIIEEDMEEFLVEKFDPNKDLVNKRRKETLSREVLNIESDQYIKIRKIGFLEKLAFFISKSIIGLSYIRSFSTVKERILEPIVSSAIACAAFTFFSVNRPNLAKAALASTICFAVPNIFNKISEKFKGNSR